MIWKIKQRSKKVAVVIVSVALAVIIVVFVLYLNARSGPQEQIPSPNGYELIRQAALTIGDELDDAKSLPDSKIAAYLEENSAALELTRKGLALPAVVPVEFTQEWIQTKVMMGVRNLGHAFETEALLYQRQGNMDQALSSALDLVRLGFSIGNRGVLIDFLVGTACEIQGAHVVSNMLERLNASQCRSAVKVLEELDRERESVDSLFQRERRWSVRAGGFLEYVKFMIEHRSLRPEREVWNSTAEVQARLRVLRQIRIRIAARAFELEKGRSPTSVSELESEYLNQLPLDPESGDPLPITPAPNDQPPP